MLLLPGWSGVPTTLSSCGGSNIISIDAGGSTNYEIRLGVADAIPRGSECVVVLTGLTIPIVFFPIPIIKIAVVFFPIPIIKIAKV